VSFRIGVDTGGTFTDCVVVDDDGNVTAAKAASTPQDFSVGVMESVAKAAQALGLTAEQLWRRRRGSVTARPWRRTRS
jgi:N-methylhydantoinase A